MYLYYYFTKSTYHYYLFCKCSCKFHLFLLGEVVPIVPTRLVSMQVPGHLIGSSSFTQVSQYSYLIAAQCNKLEVKLPTIPATDLITSIQWHCGCICTRQVFNNLLRRLGSRYLTTILKPSNHTDLFANVNQPLRLQAVCLIGA